ncbi:MAG: C4-type zinc ribbon domain-containing protein [Mailhella sp.]|nr:C4-type zinc ribbon domain-containing protein [Mailhella sp.]
MSLYIEQIRQLVALQHVDDDIHSVQNERDAAPLEVEALEKRFQAQDAQRNRILDKIQHLQEQQKRLSDDIQDSSSRLASSRDKMMMVENEREFQAMEREVDNISRSAQNREEESRALQDELASQQEALANLEDAWKDLKEELEQQQTNLAERLAAADTRLAELSEKRSSVGQAIPAPVLERYEFIRGRLRHPVIVSVEEGICSGCHIAIPPQVFIDLQRGDKIMSCPNCQRLMYWANDFEDLRAAAAAPSEEAGE